MSLQARVPLDTRLRANAVADALGITLALYIEELIARDQLDEQGRSLWAGEAGPAGKNNQALPGMETSAA